VRTKKAIKIGDIIGKWEVLAIFGPNKSLCTIRCTNKNCKVQFTTGIEAVRQKTVPCYACDWSNYRKHKMAKGVGTPEHLRKDLDL